MRTHTKPQRVLQRVCLRGTATAKSPRISARHTYVRRIGRQAPVKRCLAR